MIRNHLSSRRGRLAQLCMNSKLTIPNRIQKFSSAQHRGCEDWCGHTMAKRNNGLCDERICKHLSAVSQQTGMRVNGRAP
jgi:hypothetical protein